MTRPSKTHLDRDTYTAGPRGQETVVDTHEAAEQHFCIRCGSALIAGRCPQHGADPSQQAAVSWTDRLTQVPTRPPSIPDRAPGTAPPWQPPPPASTWAQPPQPPPAGSLPAATWGSVSRPRAPSPAPPNAEPAAKAPSARRRSAVGIGVLVLIIGLATFSVHLQLALNDNHRALSQVDKRLAAETATANGLAGRIAGLETKVSSVPDAAVIARQVRASVFTIETSDGLGSGWVVASSGGVSTLVTDYHVIASAWTGTPGHSVQVRQDAKSFTGTITKVDPGDDLAILTVKATLVPITRAKAAPMVGDSVLVVGSPLGLGGTVSNGIVSSIRSDGRIQFSAPISPGDSGGPVVNRFGEVIGVAESKLVGSGVEGLSFAIPVSTVCSTVTTC